jgi:hypothetical protein
VPPSLRLPLTSARATNVACGEARFARGQLDIDGSELRTAQTKRNFATGGPPSSEEMKPAPTRHAVRPAQSSPQLTLLSGYEPQKLPGRRNPAAAGSSKIWATRPRLEQMTMEEAKRLIEQTHSFIGRIHATEVVLDGKFKPEELEAILFVMRNRPAPPEL